MGRQSNIMGIIENANLAKRLILGHMPFIGVSYKSKEKDEELSKRFSAENAVRNVLEAAAKIGIYRFASATPGSSALSSAHLRILRAMAAEGQKIELLPCIEIPMKLGDGDVSAFRRWATYANLDRKTHSKVKQRMINDPILNFREGWKAQFRRSKPYAEKDFWKLTVDRALIADSLEYLADLPISSVELGSETDFLAIASRLDLLGELIDMVRNRGFKRVLLGVHHAGVTIPMLNDHLDGFHGYVTPLNPLGVMMFPSRVSAERAVRGTEKAVYAIKPLAGGRVDPKTAFTYAFSFDVESCMLGVSSISELKEDARAAVEVLEGNERREARCQRK